MPRREISKVKKSNAMAMKDMTNNKFYSFNNSRLGYKPIRNSSTGYV